MSAPVALHCQPAARLAEGFVPVCAANPERWTTTHPDEEAKASCFACPRRWLCAREAWELPDVEGLWAGVVVPESGRPREFAMRRLRSLAEHGGYPVRPRIRTRHRIALADELAC
jgi:WhiB family transcriptional regulator, redox-sensing transcriptional regulator